MKYILEGKKPIPENDVIKWGRWVENTKNRIVKQESLEILGKEIYASTVFLGLDHSFGGSKPLLFETLIRDEKGNELLMERYSTWEEAEEGHKQSIKQVAENDCKRAS